MDEFSDAVSALFDEIGRLAHLVEENPELLGSLTIGDYTLFSSLVRDWSWEHG